MYFRYGIREETKFRGSERPCPEGQKGFRF
jgi:hypothetical protein